MITFMQKIFFQTPDSTLILIFFTQKLKFVDDNKKSMCVHVGLTLQRVSTFGKEGRWMNGIGGVLRGFSHISDVSFLFLKGLPEVLTNFGSGYPFS